MSYYRETNKQFIGTDAVRVSYYRETNKQFIGTDVVRGSYYTQTDLLDFESRDLYRSVSRHRQLEAKETLHDKRDLLRHMSAA